MRAISAAVGYAADDAGNGVAYVRIMLQEPRVLRVAFRVQRQPALLDREVGYAALAAVCEALRRRGYERVPLVARGDESIDAQGLHAVAEFFGISLESKALAPSELARLNPRRSPASQRFHTFGIG